MGAAALPEPGADGAGWLPGAGGPGGGGLPAGGGVEAAEEVPGTGGGGLEGGAELALVPGVGGAPGTAGGGLEGGGGAEFAPVAGAPGLQYVSTLGGDEHIKTLLTREPQVRAVYQEEDPREVKVLSFPLSWAFVPCLKSLG